MAIGVSAWFDTRTEVHIRGIWKSLADSNLSRTLHEGPYRPHITLGVYETLDRPSFTTALREAVLCTPSFHVVFAGLGVFLNNPPAAFLTVTVSEHLRQLHCLVHELLSRTGRDPIPFYLADRWNPHCTLAPELLEQSFPKAMQLLSKLSLPFIGVVDRVSIIDTPAEVELDVVHLAT